MRAELAGRLTPGIQFKLKPERADAYGEPRDTIYTVKRVSWDKHSVKVWVVVKDRPEGNNTFCNHDIANLVFG